jgi:hypothetical protein
VAPSVPSSLVACEHYSCSVSMFLLFRVGWNLLSLSFVDILRKRLVCGSPLPGALTREIENAFSFAMESSQLVCSRNSKKRESEDLVRLVAVAEYR